MADEDPSRRTVDGDSPGAVYSEPRRLCVRTHGRGRKIKDWGGVMHRFGMDDDSTATMLRELASRSLPDFTLAYFADNDYESHKVGPHKALPVIERVDEALGRMFAAAGGADRFLRDMCVIVTSDHGHCEILADENRAVIRLDRLLSRIVRPTSDVAGSAATKS